MLLGRVPARLGLTLLDSFDEQHGSASRQRHAEREREKDERRRAGHVWPEAKPLIYALEVAGLDPSDSGALGSE